MSTTAIARCPKSDDHKEFVTVAHVSEDWKVDECGNFIEVVDQGEVVANVSTDNIWTCVTCGAEAEFI